MVEGLISRIRSEAKGRPLVISTGGYGRIMADESRSIAIYDEFLTLEGVKTIYDEWMS
jgi:type III pantothenate kinase